jgi:hypothetical protein
MQIFRKIYWILSTQFGVDPRRMMYALAGIPRFVAGWIRFRRHHGGPVRLLPCLYDWFEEGGFTKDEYFWQDLYVARKIHRAGPAKHVDIGSRMDGFVAHVASFMEVEVFDIRPMRAQIPGVRVHQADLMDPSASWNGYCASLSCLHALEHFGLGRYGDPIDPLGHEAGLRNMARMLQPGGFLYLSVPIGQPCVEFNAHRIFDPNALVSLAAANDLLLAEFAWIGPDRTLVESLNPKQDMKTLSRQRYALGLFTFVKQGGSGPA